MQTLAAALACLLALAAAADPPDDGTAADTTQSNPDPERLHPAEKAIIENLLKAGATCNVNTHGRLLNVFGTTADLPENLLGLLDGTPALRGIWLEKASDAMVARLDGLVLPRLETVSLSGKQVTGESLRHIARFKTIACLNLNDTAIDDAGLKHLEGLPNLVLIRLNGTPVTGRGLASLSTLPKLHTLELERTAITDASLANLAELRNLEDLFLRSTKITDRGLANLQTLPKLKALALDGTAITDKGLVEFAKPGGLRNVQHLYLESTAVTDAGLRHLDALPKLQGISLTGTRATKVSTDRFKKRPELYWMTDSTGRSAK